MIDRDLGRVALSEDDIGVRMRRLMTIPGVDATVALSIVAAVGNLTRFRSPEKLVAYFALNSRVRQSGRQPASHGRITKAGRRTPAACSSRPPGQPPALPVLRAFYQRVPARRGIRGDERRPFCIGAMARSHAWRSTWYRCRCAVSRIGWMR